MGSERGTRHAGPLWVVPGVIPGAVPESQQPGPPGPKKRKKAPLRGTPESRGPEQKSFHVVRSSAGILCALGKGCTALGSPGLYQRLYQGPFLSHSRKLHFEARQSLGVPSRRGAGTRRGVGQLRPGSDRGVWSPRVILQTDREDQRPRHGYQGQASSATPQRAVEGHKK